MSALAGAVAIVTASAGTGIGRAIARRFALEGAHVVVSDAHARRTAETAAALSAECGREVLGIPADVTDRSQIDTLVRVTIERFGQIDVLVNNAGTNRLAPVWEMSDADWHLVLDVCLSSAFYGTRAVLPHMLARRRGCIINLASVMGWLGSTLGESAYCAAKAGVMGLTRATAAEVAPYGVRVNAIAPGLIYNPHLDRLFAPQFFEAWRQRTPLGRFGEPAEVAELALFLASERSAFITGEVITISGGYYMHA